MARRWGARRGAPKMNLGTGETQSKTKKKQGWARKTLSLGLKAYLRNKLPAEKFVKAVEAIIAQQAKRFGGAGGEHLMQALGSEKLTVKIGEVYNRLVSPPENTVMAGDKPVLSANHNKLTMQSGANGTYVSKLHKVYYNIGQKPTRSINEVCKENGSTVLKLSDTIYDNVSTLERPQLTQTYGFNQKLQLIPQPDYFGFNIRRLAETYEISNIALVSPTNREQKVYGCVKSLNSVARITNINKYTPCYVKIHLIKYKGNETFRNALTNATNAALGTQTEGAMPEKHQLSLKDVTNTFSSSVLVNPRTTGIKASSEWKASVEIVASCSRKLHTGDTLQFSYKHLCGPGLRFDELDGYWNDSSVLNDFPITYGLLIEAHGPQLEAVHSATAGARYLGTSPGMLSFEYQRSVEHALPSRDQQTGVNIGSTGGYLSQKTAIRVFTKEETSLRSGNAIYNVNYSDIGTGPGSGTIYIPVMSDKVVDDAGAKTL